NRNCRRINFQGLLGNILAKALYTKVACSSRGSTVTAGFKAEQNQTKRSLLSEVEAQHIAVIPAATPPNIIGIFLNVARASSYNSTVTAAAPVSTKLNFAGTGVVTIDQKKRSGIAACSSAAIILCANILDSI
ncbi:MAG: hypothetical protein ACI9DH_001251, partial [Halioglobus sp.]